MQNNIVEQQEKFKEVADQIHYLTCDQEAIDFIKDTRLDDSALLIDKGLSDVEVVFVDDDEILLEALTLLVANKKVETYRSPQLFLKNIAQYPLYTKIVIDNSFDNIDTKGIQIIEQLNAIGFVNLYLFSGEQFFTDQIPSYVTVIVKTNIGQIASILN